MKKKYMKPSMEVCEIELTKIVCASEPDEYPEEFSYIPGQPEDEKQLA